MKAPKETAEGPVGFMLTKNDIGHCQLPQKNNTFAG
jgi:hypothetical protein